MNWETNIFVQKRYWLLFPFKKTNKVSPFGAIFQKRLHCKARGRQIVPRAQFGGAISEIRPMYWDISFVTKPTYQCIGVLDDVIFFKFWWLVHLNYSEFNAMQVQSFLGRYWVFSRSHCCSRTALWPHTDRCSSLLCLLFLLYWN